MATGKKENPHLVNAHHRVWSADSGRTGRVYDKVDESNDLGEPRRWTAGRKKEHYDAYQSELDALKPHDEIFAIHTNVKFWTHLQDKGTHQGGYEAGASKFEGKLDTAPKRATGLHLKGSLYRGKYENIKHSQCMLNTGRKNKHNEPDQWIVDKRVPFDNRLHDDVLASWAKTDVNFQESSYDMFRPNNTRSCPQMGADFMQR